MGEIETLDKDGDGGVHKYGEDDRQILGHTNPDVILGLNNTFTYKTLTFCLCNGTLRANHKSNLIGWYRASSDPSINQPAGVDYWTEENQNAYYPVPGSGKEQKVMSALTYRDGSFIKIKILL